MSDFDDIDLAGLTNEDLVAQMHDIAQSNSYDASPDVNKRVLRCSGDHASRCDQTLRNPLVDNRLRLA